MKNDKEEKALAREFVVQYGINVVFCHGCDDWFIICPPCGAQVCCYDPYSCCDASQRYQNKLNKIFSKHRGE